MISGREIAFPIEACVTMLLECGMQEEVGLGAHKPSPNWASPSPRGTYRIFCPGSLHPDPHKPRCAKIGHCPLEDCGRQQAGPEESMAPPGCGFSIFHMHGQAATTATASFSSSSSSSRPLPPPPLLLLISFLI